MLYYCKKVAILHFLPEFVLSYVPPSWKPTSAGWIKGNCPCCTSLGESRPDTKRRGGIIFSDDGFGYHCFNCGLSIRWKAGQKLTWRIKTLLKGFGASDADIQRLSINLLKEEEQTAFMKAEPAPPRAVFTPTWKTIDIPQVGELTEDGTALIKSRCLDHWHDWVGSTAIQLRSRIILPFRYKNEIVGYTARSTRPNAAKRYLRYPPKDFVFNLDRQISSRNFVVVHEGEFDAIGTDGVAIGSNAASANQCSLLHQLGKRVILLPDADAAGGALVNTALKEDWSVSFPEWLDHHKDANSAIMEYGRVFVLHSILRYAIDNKTKIKVLTKKYCK